MNRGATPEAAATDEQRSFNRLWARIEASESAAPASVAASAARPTIALLAHRALAGGRRGRPGIRPGAVRLQCTARTPCRRNRHGGGRSGASRLNAPTVRIVFAPDASIATINTLLAHQGLSASCPGPGTAGNFTAELSADAVASGASANSVADVIAKDPNVTFAQPVAR